MTQLPTGSSIWPLLPPKENEAPRADISGKELVPTASPVPVWDAVVRDVITQAEHVCRDKELLPDEAGILLRVQARKLERLVADLDAGEIFGALPRRASERVGAEQ
jgi:hypothetical protein